MGSAFESIVGGAHVRPSEDERIDGVVLSEVVCPGSASEVAECLRLASTDRIPLLPRGGGSKIGWGNPGSAERWVVLDVSRLRADPEVHAEEGVVRVAAGVPVERLERALVACGRRARTPAGYPGATVGGSVATDPPDAERSIDRALRHDLLGVEVALANGTLARAGGRVVKNVTGFDLVRLYCGSFGTLGVITEVILRLRPVPEARWILAREVPSLEAAQAAIADVGALGVEPEGMLLRSHASGLQLLWVIEGIEEDVVERVERFAGDRCEEADWLSAARGLVEPCREDQVSLRLGARGSDVGALWRVLEGWAGRAGMTVALPLTGLVRAHGEASTVDTLLETAARREWSSFIESGPLSEKSRHDVFGAASGVQDLLRSVKQHFDPEGVLAPGRFLGRI